MARKITVTKAELEALERLALDCGAPEVCSRGFISILEKARAAHAPEPESTGLSLKTVNDVMTRLAPLRWAPHIAGNPSMHLKRLHQAGANEEQVAKVAAWLQRQGWMKSRATLEMLAGHWASWLSQASVDRPPGVPRSGPAPFEEE